MGNFIEVVQSVIIPIMTVALGYFGWRANADKNKLKTELKGLEAVNISKEIENQSDWIDLYKKLHNDQAERITQAMDEIEQLKKTIAKFEYALKKANSCTYYHICPIRDELSKYENRNRKRKPTNAGFNRQHKRAVNIRGPSDDDPTNKSENNPKS